ncbi:MAG: DUF4388 domain-containing protein [Proteobacteria bacterium]|nr:DUF4388 domain-containing protein [Pseudomonadota bacterium]MBU1059701.1 DUF4388 domain-containing protein [Pseudomonadota bacterium]
MKTFKLYFKIITDNNCPLYERGELLSLSEKSLSCPENKATCLILVREMTGLLFRLLDTDAEPVGKGRVFSCSGCTGLIKFELISEQAAHDAGLIPSQPELDSEAESLLARIRDFPMIKAIPEADLVRVLKRLRRERVHSGATLIRKGQRSCYLYLILSGNMVVSDGSLVIATLSPGEICGEMSYLVSDVAGADVKAITDAEVLSISGDDVSKLLDRIPGLQLYMAKVLAQRLSRANVTRFNTFDACMSGWIPEMPPAELFQIFHMNKKTGVLSLDFPQGMAKVSFREGCVINAHYGEKNNQEAIFAMLGEKEGRYAFSTGLSPDEMRSAEIGDFMMLLMEGIKRVDETGERS